MTYTANPNKAKNWASARQAAENVFKEIYQNRDTTKSSFTATETTTIINAMLPFMQEQSSSDKHNKRQEFRYMFKNFWLDEVSPEQDEFMNFYVTLGVLTDSWYSDVKDELIEDNSSDEILLERSLIDARHELKKVKYQ